MTSARDEAAAGLTSVHLDDRMHRATVEVRAPLRSAAARHAVGRRRLVGQVEDPSVPRRFRQAIGFGERQLGDWLPRCAIGRQLDGSVLVHAQARACRARMTGVERLQEVA
ncbi:MAG: hypothetical protein H0W96_07580 [Solirubrobacterales bacterium]|nr:hypothetical protein [Solirubrobacterales bacterium]